ncbi:hypothetical protein L1887_01226 [Cichorium endivia]|nr:hypothetical protein L1887_01226 [Cichorium endivia]
MNKTICGVPFHVGNSDGFEEIARVWGVPVRIDKEDEVSHNKESKCMGILTNEEPWINEYVNLKVNGSCFKVRVFEDPFRSLSLAPKICSMEEEHSWDEE